MGFTQAWAFPGAFPYTALLPILSSLLAYVYFPFVTTKRRFFDKQNILKSVPLGLAGFELYRQLLISVSGLSGKSIVVLIQQHCGRDVETFQAAIACGTAVTVTLLGINLFLWLVPATLLCSISRRRQPPLLVRSEA
jgi:ABC-type sugar transport system permease subunit